MSLSIQASNSVSHSSFTYMHKTFIMLIRYFREVFFNEETLFSGNINLFIYLFFILILFPLLAQL